MRLEQLVSDSEDSLPEATRVGRAETSDDVFKMMQQAIHQDMIGCLIGCNIFSVLFKTC